MVSEILNAEFCTCLIASTRYVLATYSSGQIIVYDRKLQASQAFNIETTIFSVSYEDNSEFAILATENGVYEFLPTSGKYIFTDSGLYTYASRYLKIKPVLDLQNNQEFVYSHGIAYDLYELDYNKTTKERVETDSDGNKIKISGSSLSKEFFAPCGGKCRETEEDFAIAVPEGVFLELTKNKCILPHEEEPIEIVDFSFKNQEIAAVLSNGTICIGEFGDKFSEFTNYGFEVEKIALTDELYISGANMLIGKDGVVFQGRKVEEIEGDDLETFFAVEGGVIYRIENVE